MPGPVLPGTLPDTFNAWVQLLQSQGFDVQQISELGITTIDGIKNWVAQQGYQIIPITQQVEQTVGYTFAKISPADAANTDLESMEVIYEVAKVAGGQAVSEVISGRNKIIGAVSNFVAVGACLSLLVESIGSFLVPHKIQEELINSVNPYTIDGENVPVLIDENGKTHFLEEMVEAVRAKAIELGLFSNGDIEPQMPKTGTTITIDSLIDPYTFFEKYTFARHPSSEWYSGVLNGYRELIDTALNGDHCLFSISQLSDPNMVYIVAYPAYHVGDTMTNYSYGERVVSGVRIGVGSLRSINTTGARAYRIVGNPNGTYTISAGTMQTSGYIAYPYDPVTYPSVITPVLNIGTAQQAIEGITPSADLISAGVADVTKPLTEVLPQLATGQMSIASPTENDLTHKSNWYPVSINSEDIFTDGATEEETSTATDGDVKEDLQPLIADAIQSLIEHLYPDGIPSIEVGDSGDTPPENPPLTPPSGSTGSNGLWSIYNPTMQQVNDFGAWLWSDSLADQFKRIFNSPIDGVIGFHMLYCTPSTGTAKPIKCGFLQSPVSAPVVTNPYVEINCGTVSIDEYYRNALDYDNTRISVYLPFVGIVPMDTNIVMGSDINITYRVDVLTGTCLAQIKVLKDNSDAVMYAFDGNCAVQIPLTATTYTGMVGALLGGISAGASIMTGNMVQAVGSGMRALASGMTGLSGAKQSGTFGANVGALGIRIPYVIITHPVSAMPGQFNKLEGIPSNNAVVLGSLSGYTRVRSVHLENIGKATQEEIQMIQEQLESGVII